MDVEKQNQPWRWAFATTGILLVLIVGLYYVNLEEAAKGSFYPGFFGDATGWDIFSRVGAGIIALIGIHLLNKRAKSSEKIADVAQRTAIDGQFSNAIGHIASKELSASFGGVFIAYSIAKEHGEPFASAAFSVIYEKLLEVCREESTATWNDFTSGTLGENRLNYPISVPFVVKSISLCTWIFENMSESGSEICFERIVLVRTPIRHSAPNVRMSFEDAVLIRPHFANITFGESINGLAFGEVIFNTCRFAGTKIELGQALDRNNDPQNKALLIRFENCKILELSQVLLLVLGNESQPASLEVSLDANGNAEFKKTDNGWKQVVFNEQR